MTLRRTTPPAAPEGRLAEPGPGGAGDAPWSGFLAGLESAIDAHAIVAATDAAGTITHVNDRFCTISGYSREELLGANHRILKSGAHPPEFYADLWATISGGRTWRGVICNRAKDGRLYWVDSTIVPFADASGRPARYLALRTEVTRLKETEEELGRLTRELERRVEERTLALEEANRALSREMEERRHTTEKLAKRESLYRLLFQSVTDYFYTVEVRHGKAVHTEHMKGCEAVTGYGPEEFSADPMLWIKMVAADDRPAVEAQATAALEGRTPPPLEHRIVRKDGEVRWIRNTIVVRRDEKGRLAYYDGIISDITSSRLAQEEVKRLNQELEGRVIERTAQLKAASEQLRILFDFAPVGISWVEWGNPDVYHLNERFCQIIGLTAKEAESFDNIMAATHPDDRLRQRRLIEELWSGRRDRYSVEKRYLHRDGRVVWANLTVAVLRDGRGRIVQQFAMVEDITERREAEDRVRRSEARFRRYVENANEILYSLSADERFLYVSPIWTAKLGHPVEDVIGQPVATFVHEEDMGAFREFLAHVLEHGRSTFSVEYRVRHADGRPRWHASSGAVYFDEAGEKLYMGVARDITERKRNQEELRASLARRDELSHIINRSPSVVVLWRAGEGWPVEFISRNISQYGYAPEEFLSGRIGFVNIMHPADAERVAREVVEHGKAGHGEYRQEYRILARDGSVHWIDDRTLVRTDATGTVTHHEGILTDITERVAAEERERENREREMRVARDVQRHLLPGAFPELPEVEVGSLYIPSGHLGGDYFDFFEVAPRRWAFVVGDVSGKGASAALIMAACRTALRLEARRAPSPGALLRSVNRLIHPDMPEGMFISMVCAVLDLDERRLRFARAGHETPIVVRAADGAVEPPEAAGLALGLDEGALFDEILEERELVLGPGDLFTLYTDGLTEATNGLQEEFGGGRLARLLAEHRALGARELATAVNAAIEDFAVAGAVHDDRTMLILRMR